MGVPRSRPLSIEGIKGMINEEATFEQFGYHSTDLKPKSNKKIVAVCDDCGKVRILRKQTYHALCTSCAQKGERNPNYGKHHSKETRKKIGDAQKGERHPFFGKHPSEETRKKISDVNKGKKNPNYGKHHSEETRKKMSDAHKGERNPNYGKHPSEETKQKLREARKHRHFPLHHTKPECVFEEICKKYNLPFKYTGDGSFWIGKNPSVNPDFVECNGKKLAVEIFGDYWHSPLQRYNICYSQTFKGRKEALKKYGWKLVILWETDLKRVDAETFVLNELRKEGI